MPDVPKVGLLCHTLTVYIRLISWNPLSLQDYDKRLEISRELEHISAALFSEFRQRPRPSMRHTHRQSSSC
eukprot:9224202-Pyramimonas_sp.AAC.1